MHIPEQPDASSSPVVTEISREIAEIHADRFGHPPTVEFVWQREDILVCVLRDVFTRAEQVLIDAGRFELVRANREVIEQAAEPRLREAVERTGTFCVHAVLHQVDADGTAVMVFLLKQPATA